MPAPGDLLNGKYRVERVIGEGGMGVVFEALHQRLDQRVAIKMLQPSVLVLPEFVERFEREARAAARVMNANAVRILDVDTTPDGQPYIVMELLEGHDVAAELDSSGPLSIARAVDIVMQAAAAMSAAHAQGIIHRDLKPSNLFLAREGTSTVVKVLDFGISKITSADEPADSVTNTKAALGTPVYMSPEQIRSTKNVDARTDVWSLGIILFELLTGKTPFEGNTTAVSAAIVADPAPSVRALRPDTPEQLEAVVQRALRKHPDDRWPDMKSFSAALAPFRGLPTVLHPASARHTATSTAAPTLSESMRPPTGGSWSSNTGARHRSRAGLVLLIGGPAALLLGVLAQRASRSDPPKSSASAPDVTSLGAPPVVAASRADPAPRPPNVVPAEVASSPAAVASVAKPKAPPHTGPRAPAAHPAPVAPSPPKAPQNPLRL